MTPLGLDNLLPDPLAHLSDGEVSYAEDRLAGLDVLQKGSDNERVFQAVLAKRGGDNLRSDIEKRFNPRQPRNADGEWMSGGGVVPKDVELAHHKVGGDFAEANSAGPLFGVGKKVQRGEKLTRTERTQVRSYLKGAQHRTKTPVAHQRYRDFAAFHGMNLKTKTKGEHPGKQVGNPGVQDARSMSDADKIKAFKTMHGRSPTDKELKQAGMNRREDVPIREPDPDMERQRAEERVAERGGDPLASKIKRVHNADTSPERAERDRMNNELENLDPYDPADKRRKKSIESRIHSLNAIIASGS